MKTQRLAIILTIINLVILVIALALVVRPVLMPEVAPVLRGRALEIVDNQGRLRAQIIVTPATTQEGKTYAEGVLFRLIDVNGRPSIKLGTSVEGSGLLLLARDSEQIDWSGVQILADDTGSQIRLIDEDGREQIIKP